MCILFPSDAEWIQWIDFLNFFLFTKQNISVNIPVILLSVSQFDFGFF